MKIKNYLAIFCSLLIFLSATSSIFISNAKTDDGSTATIETVAGGLGNGNLAVNLRLEQFSDFALDRQGSIFLSQTPLFVSDIIRRVDVKTGINTIIAGLGSLGIKGETPALATEDIRVSDIKTDASGRFLFLACSGNIDVIELATGSITRYAGKEKAARGDGGPAIEANVSAIQIQLDLMDNLFLYDLENTIRRIDRQTRIIQKVAGGGKTPLSKVKDPLLATEIDFDFDDIHFALDQLGNIFFHSKNKIFRIDAKTNMVSPISFNKQGFDAFTLKGITLTSSNAPIFIASIKNNEGQNEALLKLDTQNNLVILAGNKKSTNTFTDGLDIQSTTFSFLEELFVDSEDNIFVADTLNKGLFFEQTAVLKINTQTNLVTVVAGNNKDNGDGALATKATINNPEGLVIDNIGNIFLSDTYNHRVRRVDIATGIITTVAGNGKQEFSGDKGLATQAGLNFPRGLAIDTKGNLFIADNGNGRVRRVDAKTGIITSIAGNPDGLESFNIKGEVDPASAKLDRLNALSFGLDDNTLFISKFEGIFKVDLKMQKLSVLVPRVSDVNDYSALARNKENEIIGASDTRFCGDEWEVGSYIFKFSLPDLKFSGVRVNTKASCFVYALTVDNENNILIYSPELGRIARVENEKLIEIAGSIAGFSGDGGPLSKAKFSFISRLAVDRFGNIYFTDTLNNAIRVIKGLTKEIPITLTKAGFQKQQFTIEGTNFGKYGAKVVVNGQDISAKIIAQKEDKIILAGTKKELAIMSGINEIRVQLGISQSNTLKTSVIK